MDNLTYCVKCKQKTNNTDSKIGRAKNGRKMLISRCINCGSTKTKFIR